MVDRSMGFLIISVYVGKFRAIGSTGNWNGPDKWFVLIIPKILLHLLKWKSSLKFIRSRLILDYLFYFSGNDILFKTVIFGFFLGSFLG